jgi:hypothetical protein
MSIKSTCFAVAISFLCFAPSAFGQSAAQVTVSDQRSPESLEGRRDSNFSAIAFLPEKNVKPAPVSQLQDALSKRADHPISLVISEMRVIDYFPKRIKAGPSGWLNNAIMKSLVNSKTDWSFVQDLGISNEEDSVICILAGTVDGKEIKVAAHSPYTLGGFSVMVRSDKNFKAAVTSSIDKVALQIVEQSTGVQASR